jgi:putative ABC transport system permease protein
VSESLARRLFAGSSPVGHRLWLSNAGESAEIIGITGDVTHRTLVEAAAPTVYRPALQSPSPSSIVVVRSPRPDADVIVAVREEVTRLDPNVPVYRIRSLRDVVDRSPGVPARRLLLAAFLGFAVLALVLGALGLFSVVAHDVARRRTELALRVALGADPKRLLLAAVGPGIVMIGAGLAAGAALSVWTTKAFASLLLATTAGDILSIVLAAVVLFTAGAVAVLPAAVRAARTDPVTALRSE